VPWHRCLAYVARLGGDGANEALGANSVVMGRQNLEGGGWFDPETATKIDWGGRRSDGWGVGLLLTSQGKVIQPWLYVDQARMAQLAQIAQDYMRSGNPLPPMYRAETAMHWTYTEISPARACEFMIETAGGDGVRAAMKWFPNDLSRSFACRWLISHQKAREAQELFPKEFPEILAKDRAEQR